MNSPGLHVIIPAGGAGTRLWPLSRRARPKFLLDVTGSGRTLLQATVDRMAASASSVTIVTGAAHREGVLEQLPEFASRDDRTLLVEPSGRDSMAAIGLAAYVVRARSGDDAVVGSFAADHVVARPDLLERAVAAGIFGTKMRSVILAADPEGVRAVVDQQFEIAEQIIAAGLVPIIEPEVDIRAADKAGAEELLVAALTERLDALPEGADVMLKVSIPTVDGLYSDLMKHPRVMRVVALSGGYEREDANARLARNPGLIASFSRALLEGLSDGQSQEEFDAVLAATAEGVYEASIA